MSSRPGETTIQMIQPLGFSISFKLAAIRCAGVPITAVTVDQTEPRVPTSTGAALRANGGADGPRLDFSRIQTLLLQLLPGYHEPEPVKDATMYAFKDTPGHPVLEVECGGFWSMDEAERFMAAFESAAEAMRKRSVSLSVFMDGRKCAVQAPEVMDRLDKFYSAILVHKKDKVAIVESSTLLKMQTERLLADGRIKVFTSVDDARGWLSAAALTP